MIQKRATLHEKAVQAIASGEVAPTTRPRRRAAQKAAQGLDKHIKVEPAVWKKAKEILFLGSYTDIEVIDDRTVIVR